MLKKIAVAVVAAGGLLVAAAPAMAGGHVSWSVGIGLPAVGYGYGYAPPPAYYGPPAPVYGPPAVVYESAPYYGPRYARSPYYGPRYYGPRVVYRPGPHDGYGHRDWHR